MQILLSPIVGAFYRPPAKTILGLLGPGHELVLDPEPDNPYDENAVKVGVRLGSINVSQLQMDEMEEELMKYGSTWAELFKDTTRKHKPHRPGTALAPFMFTIQWLSLRNAELNGLPTYRSVSYCVTLQSAN